MTSSFNINIILRNSRHGVSSKSGAYAVLEKQLHYLSIILTKICSTRDRASCQPKPIAATHPHAATLPIDPLP